MSQNRSEEFEVLAEDESVTITDAHGEIVKWIQDEWVEEPEVVASIVNAVKLCYEQGPAALRASINHPGERTGSDYRKMGDVVETLSVIHGAETSIGTALSLPKGSLGIITELHIGYFKATFGLLVGPYPFASTNFDWGDEGDLFVFKERVGYGDEPNQEETEFEDGHDDDLTMCVEVREIDIYGDYAGGEKALMLRAGADLNFEQIVQRYREKGSYKHNERRSLDNPLKRYVYLESTDGSNSYSIELREATEEDLED